MKYKVNDRVRIKSLDWYNENINEIDEIPCGITVFIPDMVQYVSDIVTISQVFPNPGIYRIKEDSGKYNWTDEMIEGLVEDTITTNEQLFVPSNISLEKEMEWNLPEGYIFKDENGNVINATKIVLEKKEKEYPNTYEECCKVLNVAVRDLDILDNMLDTTEIIYNKNLDRLLNSFRKLLICRDAYWKIAGEEMGLGKPWEPDWTNNNKIKFIIGVSENEIIKCYNGIAQYILAFPTAEMRDAFYENFKEEIEVCKELL